MCERAPRAALSGEWRQFLAGIDPRQPAEDGSLRRAAELYTAFLCRCKTPEVLALWGRQVLHPLDARAQRLVASEASQTALSPLAAVDVLLTLWRQVRLTRAIALLYGGRPGALGTLGLVRGILGSLVGAGVSEVIANAGAEALGGTLAATLSARVGQGMAMGVLTIRVGLVAIRLCRPIPFSRRTSGPASASCATKCSSRSRGA